MLADFFSRYLSELDPYMQQIVRSSADLPDDFSVMLRYAMGWVDAKNQPYTHTTGKRIRPILLLLCVESAGGDWRKGLPAAAAVELLHNFTLIHDDIQDDSPIRHNRSTVWIEWGRANAINAGDALFTLAYCALESLSRQSIAPEIIIKIWRIFNHTMLELTRGQHMDMRFEHETRVTTDEYISMLRGKTAALVTACAQIGALIGSADDERAAHFAEFGMNLGIAFQIRDDLLGIWGDPSVTGKSAATDILSRKKSLPVLYGLEHSSALQVVYQRNPFSEQDVKEAVELLDGVNAREYTLRSETEYYTRAMNALQAAAPQGQAAVSLDQLVKALFQRDH
ncbi:MAG: polyprenyl synthetase family protein [Anaerolineae bacterium]|nr:polyprenyl synthetase family protein [Anaerolineae bacterium]